MKAFVAYFDLLPQNLLGRTEKNCSRVSWSSGLIQHILNMKKFWCLTVMFGIKVSKVSSQNWGGGGSAEYLEIQKYKCVWTLKKESCTCQIKNLTCGVAENNVRIALHCTDISAFSGWWKPHNIISFIEPDEQVMYSYCYHVPALKVCHI